MNNRIYFLLLAVTFILACKNESSERAMEEIKEPSGNYSDLIRMPISADGTLDTVNIAKFEFEKKVIVFGDIKEGEKVEVEYNFKNVGKSALLITSAKSTCGCTVPEFPKEPVAPGEKGVIKVRFDSEKRTGYQTKPITIYANTYPNKTELILEGRVIE